MLARFGRCFCVSFWVCDACSAMLPGPSRAVTPAKSAGYRRVVVIRFDADADAADAEDEPPALKRKGAAE